MQKFIKNIFYESGKKNLIKYNSYENQLFSSLNYADFFFDCRWKIECRIYLNKSIALSKGF